MSQDTQTNEPIKVELTGAPEQIGREIRRHLPPDRIDLWEKVVSERVSGGIDAARSYLHAVVQQRVKAARSELEAIRNEVSG